MADLINITQTAAANDRLMPQWSNSVKAKFEALEQELAFAQQQLADFKSQLSQAFKITPIGGLSVSVAGGMFKTISGTVLTVSPTTLLLADNQTHFIFVNNSGAVNASTIRPATSLEIGRVVTLAGKITDIVNYPLFEVKANLETLSSYATIEYADTRAWREQARARKNTNYNIPGRDTYYVIPFESLIGSGFNTAGVFTAPQAGKYKFQCQIRITTLAVASNPNMSAKLSLFQGNVEVNTPLQQGESAYGDLTFNAENAEPVTMALNEQATIRIYLTSGTQCQVRPGSVVQVWRLP